MRCTTPALCVFIAASAALAVAQEPPPTNAVPRSGLPPVKLQAPAATVSPDAVVLTIGTEKITRAQFEDLLKGLADTGRPATTAAARRQVAEQFGELTALAQEARKRKLDQSPSVKQLIEIQTDNVLAGTLAKELSEVKPDDAAARAYYDAHKSEYEQVKASHILIRFQGSKAPLRPNQKDLTDAEALAKAQEIRKKLVDGADFAATAKAESDDTGSGANGGSLGTFGHGQMVGPFEQAAFTLQIGQISEPIKTPFGYHIIKVEARTSKTFEEAKADVGKQMSKDALDNVRKQTPVTLDETYFGKEH